MQDVMKLVRVVSNRHLRNWELNEPTFWTGWISQEKLPGSNSLHVVNDVRSGRLSFLVACDEFFADSQYRGRRVEEQARFFVIDPPSINANNLTTTVD